MGLFSLFKNKKTDKDSGVESKMQDVVEHVDRFFVSALKYFEGGSYRNAEEKFQDILQIDPNNAKAHFYLGMLYEISVENDAEFENVEQSMIEYKLAFELDPKHMDARIRLAMLNLKGGFFEESLRGLEEAIAISDNYAEAHAKLGEACFRIGLKKESKTRPPTDNDASTNFKEAEKYFKRAMDEFIKAISIDSSYSDKLSSFMSRLRKILR